MLEVNALIACRTVRLEQGRAFTTHVFRRQLPCNTIFALRSSAHLSLPAPLPPAPAAPAAAMPAARR